MNTETPTNGGSDFGWFAYPPNGANIPETETDDAPIRFVTLRADEYAGPFRGDHMSLGDDFDELHRWLGISRPLYDDVMAWNDEYVRLDGTKPDDWKRPHFDVQQELLRRLAVEVHQGIEVQRARAEPPVEVSLLRLNQTASDSSRLVLWDASSVERDEATVLPPLPSALVARILNWVGEAWKYDHSTGDIDAEIWAWQDEGDALSRELQAVLGDDYEVKAH